MRCDWQWTEGLLLKPAPDHRQKARDDVGQRRTCCHLAGRLRRSRSWPHGYDHDRLNRGQTTLGWISGPIRVSLNPVVELAALKASCKSSTNRSQRIRNRSDPESRIPGRRSRPTRKQLDRGSFQGLRHRRRSLGHCRQPSAYTLHRFGGPSRSSRCPPSADPVSETFRRRSSMP